MLVEFCMMYRVHKTLHNEVFITTSLIIAITFPCMQISIIPMDLNCSWFASCLTLSLNRTTQNEKKCMCNIARSYKKEIFLSFILPPQLCLRICLYLRSDDVIVSTSPYLNYSHSHYETSILQDTATSSQTRYTD